MGMKKWWNHFKIKKRKEKQKKSKEGQDIKPNGFNNGNPSR